MKSHFETEGVTKDVRDRLNLMDENLGPIKLETLDGIFDESKEYPEKLHELYVQPLLEAGLTLEDSLTLFVDGVLRPN